MIPSDITQDDRMIMENILSLMEYAYRIGIAHGAQVKDPIKIDELFDVQLGKKFRVLIGAPDKPITSDKFRDVVVVWCSRFSAMYLRNMLRADIKLYALRNGILTMAFVYYRDGARIGASSYSRAEAKVLIDTVHRGKVHYNAVTKKQVPKAVFFDELKYRTNLIHEELISKGAISGLSKLSTFMGATWVKSNL